MNKVGPLLIAVAIGILVASMTGPCKQLPQPPAPAPAPVPPPAPTPPRPSPLPDGLRFGVVNEVESLDAVLQLDVPVLVKFGAEYCGPCQRMAPDLKAFAADVGQDVLVVGLEVTRTRSLFERYRVSAMPTLVVFVQGQEKGRKEGLLSGAQISKFVDGALK